MPWRNVVTVGKVGCPLVKESVADAHFGGIGKVALLLYKEGTPRGKRRSLETASKKTRCELGIRSKAASQGNQTVGEE